MSGATTDHDEIRSWAEEHGGRPVKIETPAGNDKDDHGGILRIDFGAKNDNFTDVEWDEWFDIFEQSKLAIILGSADESKFAKLIARDGSPRK